jgi:hypothetical protein
VIRRLFGCLFRLLILAVAALACFFFLAPSLIRGAGNTLISALNNSSAQGVAQFIPGLPGKTANVQIQLSGLLPSTTYYATLDEGQCGGKVLANLGKVSTDNNGSVTSLLTLNDLQSALKSAVQGDLQQGLYVDVHYGSPTGKSVACGKVLSQIGQLVTPTPTPTPAPAAVTATTAAPTPTPTPTSSVVNNVSPVNSLRNHGFASGFPNTGVAPSGNNGYDNYTYPRKY